MKTGVGKLQDEYNIIKKSGVLSTIAGSAGPTKRRQFKHWRACFIGPAKTPYENGLYYIEMIFTDNYPKVKPKVRIRTKTWHPNIDGEHICVDYLNDWKETNDIVGIINAVFDLLASPYLPSSYHGIDESKAREYKSKYAGASQKYNWDDENWEG